MNKDPHTRISFTFVGGPLDGRELVHQILTEALMKEQIHKHDFIPEGELVGEHAQGVYHVEQTETGYVAIHHPSDHDQQWHIPEPQKPVEVPATKEAKKEPKKIEVPATGSLAKRMARLAHLFPKKDG